MLGACAGYGGDSGSVLSHGDGVCWENGLYRVQQAFEGSQRQVMPVI